MPRAHRLWYLCLVMAFAHASFAQNDDTAPKRKKRPKAAATTTAELPKTRPPTLMLVSQVNLEAKELWLEYWEYGPSQMVREVEVEKDGKKVKQTQTYTVLVWRTKQQRLPMGEITASSAGKALASDSDWTALKGQMVLVAPPGEKIDPAYLKTVAKDAVVVDTKPI